jgi:lipopolysaccharide/colanic/teichoic acid biosynthesis glycosyltransferase
METEEKKIDASEEGEFTLEEVEFPDDLYTTALPPLMIKKSILFVKRCLDIVAPLAGLIIMSPIMVILAIAVKMTSPGPVFYSQVRVGNNGKKFNMIKFRSMQQNAEQETGPIWAEESREKQDPRVTPIGDFLRKSHLDELPQLFLVLRGTMSLVGPRPERPEFVKHLDKEIAYYKERTINLKPGITGISQLNHEVTEDMDTKDKLAGDHAYSIHLCNMNALNVLLLDLKILFKTVYLIIFKTGA